jgi:hypothetical protein
MSSRGELRFRGIALVLSIAVMPMVGKSASSASPSPTPANDQYLITWNFTAHGHGEQPMNPSQYAFEGTLSAASEGQALVNFDALGKRLGGRILKANVSYELDTKTLPLSLKILCGPISVWEHDHYSLKTLQPLAGTDWPWTLMGDHPRKQPDGSWVVGSVIANGIFSDSYFATVHRSESFRDLFHYEYLGTSTLHSVCDGHSALPPKLTVEHGEDFPWGFNIHGIEMIDGSDVPKSGGLTGGFTVPSTGPSPDVFFKEWKFRVPLHFMAGPGVGGVVPTEEDYKITVRRMGKCHVSGEIPVNDEPINPNINDEEIEMDVEHGSDTIDPDKGVAALNIRVTCDTVPIKNAKVKITVDVQKNTGGHTHDPAGRPRGSIDGTKLTDAKPSIEKKTDDDGRIHLTFKPGKAKNRDDVGIAGIYRFTATSRIPGRKAEVAVEGKVDGLSRLEPDPNYVNDIHGSSHTSGDNATAATQQALHQFASKFYDAQVEHNQQLAACGAPQWPIYPLWVIDISLPFGGLYDDIDNNWSTPHQTHGRGDGVDFSVQDRNKSGKAADSNKSKTAWPDASSTWNSTAQVCDGYRSDQQGWLMATMMRLGMKYGHWDPYDLCQYPNVCTENGPPWGHCCPDNTTCPASHPPGFIGPVECDENKHCIHCPTPQLWHLHVNQ